MGLDELIDRFRTNLIISGGIPFEEDSWSSVTIGDEEFKVGTLVLKQTWIGT